jgi:hypothetical protein
MCKIANIYVHYSLMLGTLVWFGLVWFGLVCLFIHSVTHVTMDMSIIYYSLLYITKFIKHSIFYLAITAVNGCYKFGIDINCFQLFAYTVGETKNCQKEINISDKTTYFNHLNT